MKNIVSRRDFLTQKDTSKPTITTKIQGDDPFFKKYANSVMPFASLRTTSGLTPYTGPWTDIQIFHLLRRTTYGVTQKSIADLRAMSGVGEAVNYLLTVKQYPTTTPVNAYQSLYNDTQGCPFGESWVNYAVPDNQDLLLDSFRTEYSFKPWWIGQLINQQTDLLERMTLFWSNHFGARTNQFNNPKAIWQHYTTIRNNALGNFRTLVKAITIDPHMLNVLNGNLNTAGAPDENYARELQELFTVGKGPNSLYTEEDVKQAAKILTGWRRQLNPDGSFSTYFSDADHDTTTKQFSSFYNNTSISANSQYETDALLDMILATDEAAKYICRCLYRWFVYYVIDDSEEQNVIAPLAQILRNNNYDIAPVLTALFTSEHFFDPLNLGCIIKSPVDLYVGLCRETSLQFPADPIDLTYLYWRHFKDKCADVGQIIADPVNISGWPAYRQEPVFYEAWINSTTVRIRANILNNYATVGDQIVSNDLSQIYFMYIDSISFNKQFPSPGDPVAVIANFTQYLLPVDISASQKDAMKKSILLNNLADDSYWTKAWNSYLAAPGDAIAELTVRQLLNKLIDYITRLEEYQLF